MTVLNPKYERQDHHTRKRAKNLEHDRHIIELLAASHAMRDTVARALHLGLRCRADELAQNIQNAAVLVDGQRLEGTEEEDPPQ